MTSTCDLVLSQLSKLSNGKEFIPLHEPVFEGNEETYVAECIRTGWVSSVGSYVDLLERNLADYLNVKRVVVTVNGTAALHLALIAAGVMADDEVLVPALTFVATANAVAYTAATPHFCDSSPDTLGLCPNKLAEHLETIAAVGDDGYCHNKITGKRIKAVIPMHCMGHPVDMDNLVALASRYNIAVIEDAAESLGSLYRGKQTGGLGLMGAISFNGNKIITAGGGGAIATNDEVLGARLKHLSTTAKTSKGAFFFHDTVGYNYRMPNLNAALCCAQLERLPEFLAIKRGIARHYEGLFAEIPGVSFIKEPAHARSNYWLCSIRVEDPEAFSNIINEANQRGIMVRPLWDLMHKLPMYAESPSMNLDVATMLNGQVISLPSSVNLEFIA